MNGLNRDGLREFVNAEISAFHNLRIERVRSVDLKNVLRRKNPFLFRARNNLTAHELISG